MEKFQNLRKWLKMENDHLRMYKRPIRGIYSNNDIKKGQYILKIPSKYIIHYEPIKNKRLHNKLNNRNSDIARFLLLESLKKKSFYKPYLDSMPTDFSDYLFFYKKDDLNLLKKTSLYCPSSYNFVEQFKEIKEDSKIIYEYLINRKLINMNYNDFFKLFLKFRILVCSRVFGYTKDFDDEVGLVPYADLFNHSNKSNTTWYFNSSLDSFILEATKDIKKNEEIYDSYGNKTNEQLLRYYSFTIPKNKNSIIKLKHKNNIYELDEDTSIKDKSLIDKLKMKVIDMKKTLSGGKIKNRNIVNIINDEIRISQKIIKNN